MTASLAFASHRVQEIDTAKGAGDNGIDLAACPLKTNLNAPAHVREDIALSHLNEGKFGVVAMSKVI